MEILCHVKEIGLTVDYRSLSDYNIFCGSKLIKSYKDFIMHLFLLYSKSIQNIVAISAPIELFVKDFREFCLGDSLFKMPMKK